MKKYLALFWLGIAAAPSEAHPRQTPSIQYPLRFDMQDPAGPLASGFLEVTDTLMYPSGSGTGPQYGWVGTSPMQGEFRGPNPFVPTHCNSTLVTSCDSPIDSIVEDNVRASTGLAFKTDMDPGDYMCVLYLGDLGGYPNGRMPLVDMRVRANGNVVADSIHALTLDNRVEWLDPLGGYRKVRFQVTVGRERYLTLRVDHQPSATPWQFGFSDSVSIMGLEIYPADPAPVYFDHDVGGLETSVPGLQAGVSMFNAHDYEAALAAFRAFQPIDDADRLAKAWALAWHQGWMTAEPGYYRRSVFDEIESLLDALAPSFSDDFSAMSLREQLADFRLGTSFMERRSYSPDIAFEAPFLGMGPSSVMVSHLAAGVHLLEQMSSDVLSAVEDDYATESPFFVKSQFLIARMLFGLNNLHATLTTWPFPPAELPAHAQLLRITETSFSQARIDALFPTDMELIVFAWYVRNFFLQGGWDGASLPPIDPQASWWAPYIQYPDPVTGPAWATSQLQALHMAREVGRWWIDNYLLGEDTSCETPAGEFGGGLGDDVELPFLGIPIFRLEPEHAIESRGINVLASSLFDSDMDLEDGYQMAIEDVEHSAERTTNPLTVLMQTEFGNPRWVEYAMRTARNMHEDDPLDPSDENWTALLPGAPSARRHFRSYHLGATGVNTATPFRRDILLNTRAVAPGFQLLEFNHSPLLGTWLTEWARAWADRALDTVPSGKPIGIFPGNVEVADTGPGALQITGYAQPWWEVPLPFFPGTYRSLKQGDHRQMYAMLGEAFRREGEVRLLTPLAEAVAWLANTRPDVTARPGSEPWLAAKLTNALTEIAEAYRGEITSVFGPGGATTQFGHVDGAMIDGLVASFGKLCLQYLVAPVPPGGKVKTDLVTSFQQDVEWLEYFFPFATSLNSFTDKPGTLRVPTARGAALFETHAGSCLSKVPYHRLSWSNPDPQPHELSILVNEASPTRIATLCHNFELQPVSIEMIAWRGLEAGVYRVRVGADGNQDDVMDDPSSATVTPPIEIPAFPHRFMVQIPPGLHVVELIKTGNTSAAAPTRPDLAISECDMTYFGTTLSVRVHNIGTANVGPALANVVVTNEQSGAVLGQAQILTIVQPSNLTPSFRDVNLPGLTLAPNVDYRISIEDAPSSSLDEITRSNNSVLWRLPN